MNRVFSCVAAVAFSAILLVVGVSVAHSAPPPVEEFCETTAAIIADVEDEYAGTCSGSFPNDSEENAATRAELCGDMEVALNEMHCTYEAEGCCG